MINSIIDAIRTSLNTAFGEGYEIYTEGIEQGLKEPCFSVYCTNFTRKLYYGIVDKRYFMQNTFCIQYFPATDEVDAECADVSERLLDCLEYVIVQGDLTRGTKMHGELVGGIFSFFVDYDMHVYKIKEKIKMGELKQAVSAKG